MNFSKIKMMFFDFDDTLLIHYREQRLDSTGEAHRERLLRRQVETKDGYRVFDEIGEPNELIKQFLAEHPDVPKYCISFVQDSITLPLKKHWLEMHFPNQFYDMIGTSSPERKVTVMQMYAKVCNIPPYQILFVDDYYKAVDAAADAGFCAMSTTELMQRQLDKSK